MNKKEKYSFCFQKFAEIMPNPQTELHYASSFQLLVAVILSAQCTDKRVNMVTPALFKEFPDAASMAVADLSRVEKLIKTCGLYKTKAKDLIAIAGMLMKEYGGEVPDTIEELTKLPGIGRKTANLVCGDIFGQPAVVTDTHFIRLCNRLGLVNTTNPAVVEKEMRKLLDPQKSNDFCHRTVLFGRDICSARNPRCAVCDLTDICLAAKSL